MPKPTAQPISSKSMVTLSRLLLSPRSGAPTTPTDVTLISEITGISRADFDELVTLANLNHVVVRGLEVAINIFRDAHDDMRLEWAETALAEERARIKNAVPFLHSICAAFQEEGLDVTVIKSLDHWPDLGSDLDLYTNVAPDKVVGLMKRRFHAELAARSWGDRLARKWNFMVPGLPEAVEIHMGRLGQTGEQITLAERLMRRTRLVRVEDCTFRVPSASDRLMISTLQRMYRHFYFRLCDIVDSAALSESGAFDYGDLRSSANASGIWEGVATYMAIVSDYVKEYRGVGLDLPRFVTDSARFGGEEIYFRKDFLRVPIMPQSAGLYGTQLTGLLRKRELHSSARLGLLPWLATAAAVGQKITGSDKGIW
ncbi:MAG: nucleotidyltransferase family protein [Acidobacteriaceae bacterium]